MEKKIIHTENAPAAIGPYSQGIDTGSLVFTSGQIPVNPATGELVNDDVRSATRQVMKNIAAILQQADTGIENIIKTTIFLKDIEDFAAVNEEYASFFDENPPARSTIQVGKLPLDALVEIEAIAVK